MKMHEFGYVKKKKGEVGIEIEVEFKNDPLYLEGDEVWSSKKEDSLRFQGVEFITTKPIEGGTFKKNTLKKMCAAINKKDVIKDSPRTSVHTHHNVLDHSPTQVATTICIYWAVENLLARVCGEDRESNLFCMRLKDAEGLLDRVLYQLDQYPPYHTFGDQVKYSGGNPAPIGRFGSFEIRLKGGSTDPDDIDEWSTEMGNIVKAGLLFDSPEDFFLQWQRKKCDWLLDIVFSTSFASKLKSIPKYRELMEENALLISELAFAKDWDKWEKALEEKAYAKPKRTGLKMYSPGLVAAVPTSYTEVAPTPIQWTMDSDVE